MEDFVAYPSRWRIAVATLVAAGFVALGLWMLGAFGPPPPSRRYPAVAVVAVGWLCVAFFGLFGVFNARRMFDGNEELRIGPAGIRWTRWSDQTIPWSAVIDVTTWKYKGQRSIVLHLRDATRFPGKPLLALLARLNRPLTGGDIVISLTGTNRSFIDGLSAIERFRA